MVIEKKGYRWFGENIFTDDLFESEEAFQEYEEVTIYECSKCNEQYPEEYEAEECCKDE